MANTQAPAPPADPLIAAFLSAQRGWSPAYQRNHLLTLNAFARYLSEHRDTTLADAARADCDAYFFARANPAPGARKVCGSTANKEWLRVRAFYFWAVDNGDVEASRDADWGPMQKVQAPQTSDPDPARTREISPENYERLMASLDKRKLTDCRNGAMFSLMYRTGLRGVEVTRIDVERLHLDAAVPTVEVLGKGKRGGKWRTVPLAAETLVWIERYLRRLGVEAPRDGALFLATWNGHEHSGGRMGVDALHEALQARSAKLGIRVSSHQFRRAAASDARERRVNDSTIIEVFGWEDGRMLKRYTKNRAQQIAVAEYAAADPTAHAAPAGALRRGARKPVRRNLRAVS